MNTINHLGLAVMNLRKHISLITALAVMVNAAFSILAGDRLAAKATSALGAIPICTLDGIQYKDAGAEKHAPADNKHCVLCYWSSLSTGVANEPASAVYDAPLVISGTAIIAVGAENPKLYLNSHNCSRAPPSYL